MVAKLAGWAKRAGEKAFPLHRVNIGPRLTLCFIFIILAMLLGYAVLVRQFQLVRAQAERLSGVDQELIVVLQTQTNLMAFYDRLDELAHSENNAGLTKEALNLRNGLIADSRDSRERLSRLPPEVQVDPALLPTLVAIQDALPPQLEAIIALAESGDWDAVRLRLTKQVQPLKSRSSALAGNIGREVGEARAQAIFNIEQAQQRIFLTVPITALLTLLFAALLGWVITRSITEPLRRLLHGSRALARGEFHHQVSVIGEDELAHVSMVFNETAGKLQELYDGLRRLASLVENSTDFIGMASLDGKVLFVNPAGQVNVGLAGNGQVSEISIRDYMAEQDRQRFENEILPAVFKDGRWEGETHFRHFTTGAAIPMWQHVFFVTEAGSGRRLALATICRDITERKRTQEFLRQAQAELARVNRVMVVGEMAASIAHEVNQPLTGIVAHAGTGLRWLAANPPDIDETRQALAFILRDGNRAAAVIARIRALVEKVPPRREHLDINEAILEVMALMLPESQKNQVELRSRLAGGLPLVPADRVQLQQVILNLIGNAIEAVSGADHSPRELVVASAAGDANEVVVEVRDSGPGLGAADPRRIFDSFYTTKSEGMGMGLSICRSIVEAHGGRLWASPNQPHGAVFRFTLPVEEDATSLSTAAESGDD